MTVKSYNFYYAKRSMILFLGCFNLFILSKVHAQVPIIDTLFTPDGDSVIFEYQIPTNYSADHPPAIMVGWHSLAFVESELFINTDFENECEARGWIVCMHRGPFDRHWNTRRAQNHCKAMLDSLYLRHPFSLDSIYMVGGSMGGSGGQIWHNNNCGIDDYMCAANAIGSPILDCQLRQEEYLAAGDTNRSMRAAFGGLPGERDSVAFQYHRYSAIFFADTSQSMHFNSLRLPIWATWGTSNAEQQIYGSRLQTWNDLRTSSNADSTLLVLPTINGHAWEVMRYGDVCDWLKNFSLNRYPDFISINADENDQYYWTEAELAQNDTIFGRYGAKKSFENRSFELTLIRNISTVTVNWRFPWPEWDSLYCDWQNLDSQLQNVTVMLQGVEQVLSVRNEEGTTIPWNYSDGNFTAQLQGHAQFHIYFGTNAVNQPTAILPDKVSLTSAYPNPFNSDISLVVESNSSVKDEILLYDVLGREAQSISVELNTGEQKIMVSGSGLTSGIYFVKLKHTEIQPLKIVLMK